jgi:hypothetical protein
MYYVYLNGTIPLYDLRSEDLVMTNPTVTLKENNAGTFTFTILPTHPYYDQITKMKSTVKVYDNDDEIFSGRVINEKVDFFNRKKVTCEGELGYLNDSIQRPAVYRGITVREYLEKLIAIHNAQVEESNLAITFNSECAGESASYDYASLYYVKDGQVYSAFTKKKADDLASQTFVIPSMGFYVYWHTDSTVNWYYGLSVDSVEVTDAAAIEGTVTTLPSYNVTEVSKVTDITTAHTPYENNSNIIWHYTHSGSSGTVGKTFKVGVVTVKDSNDYVYKYTNWENTLSVIKTDLLNTYGGHLRIRNENGIRYIDYLANYPNTNTQVIEFGQNLLDFDKDSDATDIATAIIPLGARLDDETDESDDETEEVEAVETDDLSALEERLTIAEINDGCDFVYSPSAVNTYGWICKTVTFDSVKVAENLLRKGKEYLQDIQFENLTLEVKVLDLHMLNPSTERIKLLDEIRVVSEPNGLDRFFPVTEMTVYLDSPSENTITLGQTVQSTMTATASSNNATILKKINEIPSTTSVVNEAVANATALIHSALNGYVVTSANEQLIMDTGDINTARKLWRWNLNGLGYSSTGYNGTYATAITMDGQIVGDRIVAGSIAADKLDVTYKTSVEKSISSAQSSAQSYTDSKLTSYYTKTEVETSIQTSANAVKLSAKETAETYVNSKLTSYSTSAEIKVTTDAISTEVSKKLNSSDLSTKIEQSASAVKIAWNNISKYIQFESGELRIYDSASTSAQKIVSKFNYNGSHFYRDGTYIGKIGTNNFSGDTSYRGLVFDIEYATSYMCWAAKDSSDASNYTVKLIYHHKSSKSKEGIHFQCPTYTNGYLYLTASEYFKIWTTGGAGFIGKMTWNNSSNDTTVMIDGLNKQFKVYGGTTIDFYTNLDMHNYSINNSSDARLKTNIQDTKIKGLEVVNGIDLKEFDWIQSNEHQAIGIVAQQIQSIAPELIEEDSDTGRLKLKTTNLIYYCLKAIQELSDQLGLDYKKAEWTDEFSILDKLAFCKKLPDETWSDEEVIVEPMKMRVRN